MVLKPNMVLAGYENPDQPSVEEVAERTVNLFKEVVPEDVPGIAFLSGGQTDEQAAAHLNAMQKLGDLPWELTFSYGRALIGVAAQGVERRRGQGAEGAGGLRPPRALQRRRPPGRVLRGDGEGARGLSPRRAARG